MYVYKCMSLFFNFNHKVPLNVESLKIIFQVFWAKESISALNFTLHTLFDAEKCINIDCGSAVKKQIYLKLPANICDGGHEAFWPAAVLFDLGCDLDL